MMTTKKEKEKPVNLTNEFYKRFTKAIRDAPIIYYNKTNHYIRFSVMFENGLYEIARFNTDTYYFTLKILIDPKTLAVLYDLLEKLGYKYEFSED